MSTRAWAYVCSVLGTALFLGVLALLRLAPTPAIWETFAALTVLATLAQLPKAEAPNHVLFYASPIFFFAGVLLLPPLLIMLLVAIPHLIEWGKERWRDSPHLRAWYLQPFNIAMNGIAGVTAYWLHVQLTAGTGAGAGSQPVVAGLAAALAYVMVNHLLLGTALILARGVSWRDSGMLDGGNLLTDLVLACVGLVVATLWRLNPGYILPALAPLVLMYRALMIPQLKHLAEVDAKTGLANAGHFKTLFAGELERARRFDRPLAVIMADLDLLREINNSHGHLAGDAVLAGIGQIIRRTVREYDLSARFGGEEFALVAPEAQPHLAEALAERLRQAVAEASFPVGTRVKPIGVTMSLGVACFPQDGNTAEELIFAADMAVYEAKARGRNCVVRAADLPWDRRVAQPLATAAEEPAPAATGPVQPPAAEGMVPATVQQPAGSQATGAVGAPSGALAPEAGAAATGAGIPVETAAQRAQQEGQARGPGGAAEEAGQEQPAGGKATTYRRSPAAGLLPQPGVALATMGLAVAALFAGLLSPGATAGSQPLGVTVEAMALAGALVLAYQFPIHIQLYVKAQLSTMVYYLMAALLPLSLAVVAAGLGTLLGEISVRQQRRLYPSDIATAVGRWMVLVLLGTLVAHIPAPGDFGLAMLAGCALVLWAGDLVTLPLILASISGERPLRLLRALAVDTAVPDGIQYLLGFLGVLVAQRAGWALVLFAVPAVLVYQASKHLHEIQDSTHRLLEGMADTVDLRDPYTGGHSRRVTEYCAGILREMKLGGPERDLILSAARVHDIGKIALPDAILNKTGPLTAEELALMQEHPERGAEVLSRHRDFRRGVALVLHHHEAWDGSGYPHGLKGTEIPFGARVLAVADSFDAMTSDRTYRRGISVTRAAGTLRQGRGQQWDPQVVDAFLRSIAGQLESSRRSMLKVVPSPTEEPGTPAAEA